MDSAEIVQLKEGLNFDRKIGGADVITGTGANLGYINFKAHGLATVVIRKKAYFSGSGHNVVNSDFIELPQVVSQAVAHDSFNLWASQA